MKAAKMVTIMQDFKLKITLIILNQHGQMKRVKKEGKEKLYTRVCFDECIATHTKLLMKIKQKTAYFCRISKL